MPVYFEYIKMNVHQLANPFSCATVVVADDYVDTFPHPQGLITYLHRLCVQLDVDIVSLERPVTVKGSWKTIIKIDAFLKTLISTLHSAISKGVVPSEEDFNSAYAHFEEENSYRTESLENRHSAQTVLISNDLSELKTDDYLDVIRADESKYDPTVGLLDKWYFNSNPRGKTVDKRRRRYSSSGKQPPEPYIIVEADGTSKANHANLVEIEHALSQVYKKETIEKYHKKPHGSEKQGQKTIAPKEIDLNKQEIVGLDLNDEEQTSVLESLEEPLAAERGFNALVEKASSHQQLCVRINTLVNEFECSEPISDGSKEKETNSCNKKSTKVTHNKHSRLTTLRPTARHNNSKRKKPAECTDRVSTLRKRQKKHRQGSKEKKDGGIREEMPQFTNHKALKNDAVIKQTLQQVDRKSRRHDNKASTKDTSHLTSQKVTKNISKLTKEVVNDISTDNSSLMKSKIKTSLKMRQPGEKRNKEKKQNHHKKEVLHVQYKCDQCSYQAIKHMQLLEHNRRVHLTKKFRCDECLKEFGFRKDLRRHMKCHRKAENCCDICGKMYKEVRKLLEHKRIHTDDYVKPNFPCKFCTKTFSTKYVLAYHIKSDHLGMKRSYVCPTCGKSFSQKNSYLQHANVHLGIKPFACDVCGKRFSYEKSLKEHKFMHNDDKVFSCPMCKKLFRQASGLAIHLKVHKATKDYVCSMCGKGFSQKQALVRHERIHAGEKPYECGLCKRAFADSSVLRRHMILIHKKEPKQWREDTRCHVPKRTDFFISVLNGDSLHSEAEKSDNVDFQKQYQNDHCQQETLKQTAYEQGQQMQQPAETTRSVTVSVIPGHYNNASVVKKKSTFIGQREPATTQAGSFTVASCADVKPFVGCGSEKAIMSNNITSSIAATTNHHTEAAPFLLPAVQVHSTARLQKHNPLAVSTHSMRSATHHQTPLAAHPLQSQPLPQPHSSSFVPVTYQQRQVNYDTSNLQPLEMQPVQYSTMMAQPYAQTIVFQESLGTITYHQPGVNISFPGEIAAQNVQLRHISPSVSLSSSPLPHVANISQAITSSGQMYDRVLAMNHQLPH